VLFLARSAYNLKVLAFKRTRQFAHQFAFTHFTLQFITVAK